MKVRECRVKSTTEATVDGKAVIKVKCVARYYTDNRDFVPRPADGEDTRTAKQKRRQVRREVSKVLIVDRVRGAKRQEAAINEALSKWRESIEDEMNTPDGGRQTMAELVRAYVDRREALSKSADWDASQMLPGGERAVTRSTIRDLRATQSYVERYFPTVAIANLTTQQVINWEEKMMLNNNSLSRMRKAHVVCRQALTYATTCGFVQRNVMGSLKTPTLGKHENNALDQAAAQKLTGKLIELEASDTVAAAALALHCGLRCGEICALQWKDVDLDTRHLTVSQSIGVGIGGCYLKDPKSVIGARTLWLDDCVLDILKRHKAAKLAERDNITIKFDELFIVGNADGGFMNTTTLGRKFKALAEVLDVRGKTGQVVSLHKLRHTFKDALSGGNGVSANAEVLADCMGHSRKGITGSYGTHDQDLMDVAVTRAGEWLTPTQKVKLEADVLDLPRTGTEG